MIARDVVDSFWVAMRANDWEEAAGYFSSTAVIDWPCTGERMRSPAAWAELQARYPAAGTWTFEIHALVADADTVVTEFTASDGEQSTRAIAISRVEEGRIASQTEYWTVSYSPAEWRADLVERIDSVP